MRRRHLRAVQRIEAASSPRPWSQQVFLAELEQVDERTYLVARAGSRVVGFAGLLYVLPDAHVTTVAVDPAWRRRGVATRLLLALAREAVARGATALTLEVRVSNTGAQALYRRFGFAPAGVRRGYYPPPPSPPGAEPQPAEDAIVMWAHDVDAPAYGARLDAIEAALADAGGRGGGVDRGPERAPEGGVDRGPDGGAGGRRLVPGRRGGILPRR